MKIKLKVTICSEDGSRLFGEGPYRLLLGIQQLGSLRASAQHMGMAYTKAFQLIKNVEDTLQIPLTQRTIGGRGGGGSILTPQAEELLERYGAYRTACIQASQTLYDQYLGSCTLLNGTDKPLPSASEPFHRQEKAL